MVFWNLELVRGHTHSTKPNKADLGEESILHTALEEVCEVEMGPFPALST